VKPTPAPGDLRVELLGDLEPLLRVELTDFTGDARFPHQLVNPENQEPPIVENNAPIYFLPPFLNHIHPNTTALNITSAKVPLRV
jgi:hypothetical protein